MRWWDLDAVLPLERALFPDDPWTPGLFWSELAGWPASRHYVVAEREGRVVGYAGLSVTGDADVQTLAVAPDQQGAGLGGALLDDLLEEAARRRAPAVLLEVREDNAPAQRLYARAGFATISRRRGYYDGGRVDALVMRKVLAA
ncbi:ribosomal-protein-alanine N-acetyltransferase [Motilibacter rhizosphaerae]|uniref:[Ribosomal protein bS18]-alanine N-acetyltransferase n=1 Tax=Motilibacter rhizosphaerae TaxID=598652 RepID=A0A4V2F4S6_9ACTN|nr:ribosomal protein S18-alanine N-acetyltransferase [Motilibacter rhizosphaerae]RZS90349.1 ribosomal-protein-alanine N-acetyltransferase [Motilibacter rhizosphaerae]